MVVRTRSVSGKPSQSKAQDGRSKKEAFVHNFENFYPVGSELEKAIDRDNANQQPSVNGLLNNLITNAGADKAEKLTKAIEWGVKSIARIYAGE
jgi:hypothetical protein